MKVEDIISDAELDEVHGDKYFGDNSKRDVIKYSLLKSVCGHYLGANARPICIKHGLTYDDDYDTITSKGQKYLWAAFGKSGV